jgi:hypothetical protein
MRVGTRQARSLLERDGEPGWAQLQRESGGVSLGLGESAVLGTEGLCVRNQGGRREDRWKVGRMKSGFEREQKVEGAVGSGWVGGLG